MNMNIEYFEKEFNDCDTLSEKENLLQEFIKNTNLSDPDIEELVIECRMKINDIIEASTIEEDMTIDLEIQDGVYSLYTCQEGFGDYKLGSNYYVKSVDLADVYRKTGIGETNQEIQYMIDSIKPIHWIITDDGVGTLKRKNIFPKELDFSKFFTKFA
jgi:hypothetical protein